jgi:hypothetical protein
MSDADLPSLTICVPTHEGRARTIGDALASVAEQLRPEHRGRVTVAVQDNASRDGTEAVVAAAAAGGLPVSYRRNAENVGFACNLDRVIEHAQGDWCWFVSSDDRLMPGALDRVLELLAAHPDVGGMTVNQLVLDRDLRDAPWQQTTPAVPELDVVTVLPDVDAVVGALGWIMSGVSSQIVRRTGWIEAGAPLRASADHAGSWFPHVATSLRIAASGGGWLWCPEKLVAVRSGNVDVVLDRGPRLQGELFGHLDATWGAAVGSRSPGRTAARHRYRRGLETLGLFAQIHGDRARTPRDSAWLLWTFARALGREPAFWRHDAWRLVLPAWLRRPRRPRPAAPIDAAGRGDPSLTVVAALPRAVRRADMLSIRCQVAHRGAAPSSARGATKLLLRSRWRSAGGAVIDGPPLALARPLEPGDSRVLHYRLNAPVDPGEWELCITTRPAGEWFAHDGDAVGTVTVRG